MASPADFSGVGRMAIRRQAEPAVRGLGWDINSAFSSNRGDLLPLFGIVLWALGWSMVIMAVLIRLPRPAVAVMAYSFVVALLLAFLWRHYTKVRWTHAWLGVLVAGIGGCVLVLAGSLILLFTFRKTEEPAPHVPAR